MTETARSDPAPGLFTLVLHSHLPWLAHHGRWPVGEEWLYQSWAAAYLPLFGLLRRLADEGRSHLLTLGMTPVVTAQLDDPYCLTGMHHWLANWQLRGREAAVGRRASGSGYAAPETLRAFGIREYDEAGRALDDFATSWRHGGSPLLRGLIDAETIELLGGPLAHPFQPLLHPRLREFALREGLADAGQRFAHVPGGIWAPECAYAPGLERDYAAAGVTHFMVDGPSLHGDTALGRPVADSDVIAFGRDLQVSYRVWSPKSGYPGHSAYRDFHTFDHLTGLKPARVTGHGVASKEKAPYEPDRADDAIDAHVADFVDVVRRRLASESDRLGRPAHVVAAFDTELFGHWWHEGPVWLERVLRALPEAGVRVGTLSDAIADGFVGTPVELPASSWGSGKDWQVWSGDQVADLVRLNAEVVDTALTAVDKALMQHTSVGAPTPRDTVADQILREALLTVSSDWPFMVSKDSAAEYARYRAHLHAHATREIAGALASGRREHAQKLAGDWNRADGLFGALDARRLPPMKVLLLSWEYPPVVIGGLGRHVHHLATALADAGHEVVVLNRRPFGTDPSTHPTSDDISDGVRVIAAAQDPHEFDFSTDMMAWTLAMGHAMVRAGLSLGTRTQPTTAWRPDVVHAHDWLVAHPAITLAEYFDVPLVSTIHATEAGRHSGWVSGPISRQVHAVESWLVRESDSLITCSDSMSEEITELFGPGLAESTVIRNGIDSGRWPFARRTARRGPARLLYLGRLEYEKGVHDAIAALPRIRRTHPGTTLTIAGDGTQEHWLREQARKHKVLRAIRFAGRVDHDQLVSLLHDCDAAVLPSHYEPFGIVALEAAATGAPLVTSTAGGLGEAVIDGETGMSFPPSDVAALATAVRAVLDHPADAQRRAVAARRRLDSTFDWHTVAAETAQVYLTAKRREREPHSRRPIPEHALPDR